MNKNSFSFSGMNHTDVQKSAKMYRAAVLDFSSAQLPRYIKKILIGDENNAVVDCIAKTFDGSFQKISKIDSSTPKSPATLSKRFKPSIDIKRPNITEYNFLSNFKVSIMVGNPLMINVDVVCCFQDQSFQESLNSMLNQSNAIQQMLAIEAKKNHKIGNIVTKECQMYDARQLIFVVSKARSSDKESKENIKICLPKVLNFVDTNRVQQLSLPLFGTGNLQKIFLSQGFGFSQY